MSERIEVILDEQGRVVLPSPLPRKLGLTSCERSGIEQSVLAVFEVVSLSEADYASVVAHLASMSISGGAIYDALILRAALKKVEEWLRHSGFGAVKAIPVGQERHPPAAGRGGGQEGRV